MLIRECESRIVYKYVNYDWLHVIIVEKIHILKQLLFGKQQIDGTKSTVDVPKAWFRRVP